MNGYKAVLAALAAIMTMSATTSAPAWAFGHGATPAGTCARSGMAVDNPVAEARNPFSDANPIPAKAGGFAKDGPANPRCE